MTWVKDQPEIVDGEFIGTGRHKGVPKGVPYVAPGLVGATLSHPPDGAPSPAA